MKETPLANNLVAYLPSAGTEGEIGLGQLSTRWPRLRLRHALTQVYCPPLRTVGGACNTSIVKGGGNAVVGTLGSPSGATVSRCRPGREGCDNG